MRILGTTTSGAQLAASLLAYSLPGLVLFSERARGRDGWPVTRVAVAFLCISLVALQRHFFARAADGDDAGAGGARDVLSRMRRRETRRGSTAMQSPTGGGGGAGAGGAGGGAGAGGASPSSSRGGARVTPFAEEKAELAPTRRTSTPF